VAKQGGGSANKRSGKDAIKRRRAACWQHGQQRKQQRIQAQHEREIANRALRKAGLPTPWEQACARRGDFRRKPVKESSER